MSLVADGRRAVLIAAFAATLVSGCSSAAAPSPLEGRGEVKTESRTVSGFTKVEVRHGIHVQLVVGQPFAFELTTYENLHPITTAVVTGDTLIVDTTRDYTSDAGITAKLAVPRLAELTLVGGADGRADGIDGDALVISTDAAGLTATGSTGTLRLTSKGGGIIDLSGLTASAASVDLTGGIRARICATKSVSGSAIGGVVLTVRGSPSTLNVNVGGGAAVNEE